MSFWRLCAVHACTSFNPLRLRVWLSSLIFAPWQCFRVFPVKNGNSHSRPLAKHCIRQNSTVSHNSPCGCMPPRIAVRTGSRPQKKPFPGQGASARLHTQFSRSERGIFSMTIFSTRFIALTGAVSRVFLRPPWWKPWIAHDCAERLPLSACWVCSSIVTRRSWPARSTSDSRPSEHLLASHSRVDGRSRTALGQLLLRLCRITPRLGHPRYGFIGSRTLCDLP